MKQDAHYALIRESLAEINARLRILDEAYAHLEAAAERQLELLELLTTIQGGVQLQNQVIDAAVRHAPPGNRSQTERRLSSSDAPIKQIVDGNKAYSRATHPALFRVIDLLEQDEGARNLSVRQLAQQTGVSKSWCAIAKRYMLREESVH